MPDNWRIIFSDGVTSLPQAQPEALRATKGHQRNPTKQILNEAEPMPQ